MSSHELTEQQQIDQSIEVEEKYGSYGHLVHGHNDPELTPFQRDYCQRVMATGHFMYGQQLTAQHGEDYPLEALALRINYALEQKSIERHAQRGRK